MTYLSENKQKGLRQLFKRVRLTAGFDALLNFPGLWAGLEIGNVETHLALNCDEVREQAPSRCILIPVQDSFNTGDRALSQTH